MKTLTYNPTDNPSKNVHGNQKSISDINNQRIELDKGMLISNTLKGRLNSQHYTNLSWILTTIKATLIISIKKFEKPISHSRELMRQQSGIPKYSRHSRVT